MAREVERIDESEQQAKFTMWIGLCFYAPPRLILPVVPFCRNRRH